MDEQRNQMISQVLDVPTYQCDQLLVTAAVQFCELGKNSFIDNKQKIEKQSNLSIWEAKKRKAT